MKKLLVLVGVLFLLAGCADKTSVISCSRAENNTEVTFNITYNDSKKVAATGETQMKLDFSNQTDEQFNVIKSQDFCSMILTNLNNSNNAYSNCRSTINGKVIQLTFDLDLTKVEADENDSFKVNMSKDEIITYFKNQSYTCK